MPSTYKPTGRPPGRPKGRKSASTIERERRAAALEQKAQAAASLTFENLTEEQIQALLPRDIFRLLAQHYTRKGDTTAVERVAARWAPYEHPQLSNTTLNATVHRTSADYTDAELLTLAGADLGEEGTAKATGRPN